MPSVGLLFLLVIGGCVLCVKARAAGPAAVCAAFAVLFIVSTPVGSGLPGAVAAVLAAVDDVATPALNHDTPAPAGVNTVGVTAGGRR